MYGGCLKLCVCARVCVLVWVRVCSPKEKNNMAGGGGGNTCRAGGRSGVVPW